MCTTHHNTMQKLIKVERTLREKKSKGLSSVEIYILNITSGLVNQHGSLMKFSITLVTSEQSELVNEVLGCESSLGLSYLFRLYI